ncbi:MAG TPA: hypothetical protein VFE53_07485 [Mucilaginibacter sp.]|jgi:hypothetical protein|nr:hypothetical protein [Mucilaginibacter sp.]
MKKAFFTLLALVGALTGFSQSMPPLDSVTLASPADYRAAEPTALQISNYILATPSDQKSLPRLIGARFLLDWMGGTPDYTLNLDKNVIKYFENDIDLIAVYTAALASTAIENKVLIKDSKAINSLAVKKFIAYINNINNKVDLNSTLKKMIEADQKGDFQ